MRDAGIIGFVPRGEYSDIETYDFLQFVYYEGSTYVAKKETTGNTPAENNEYWQILASGHVGDYLPITGGTLESSGSPILNLKRIGANASRIGFEGVDGYELTIEGYKNNEVGRQFNVFLEDKGNISLLKVGEAVRTVYDYKTQSVKEILVESDVVFQPGETFKIKGDTPLAGYVTTGSTAIFFTIPLPKSAEGRTISVSCNPWRVRGVQGCIVNQVNMDDYLIATPEVSGNLLKLHVRKKDLSEIGTVFSNISGTLYYISS